MRTRVKSSGKSVSGTNVKMEKNQDHDLFVCVFRTRSLWYFFNFDFSPGTRKDGRSKESPAKSSLKGKNKQETSNLSDEEEIQDSAMETSEDDRYVSLYQFHMRNIVNLIAYW